MMRNPSDGRLELLVKDLVPSDMSNYTCRSVNKAGFHERNGTITVNCEEITALSIFSVFFIFILLDVFTYNFIGCLHLQFHPQINIFVSFFLWHSQCQ